MFHGKDRVFGRINVSRKKINFCMGVVANLFLFSKNIYQQAIFILTVIVLLNINSSRNIKNIHGIF